MNQGDTYAGLRAFLLSEVGRRGLTTQQLADRVGASYWSTYKALRGLSPCHRTLGLVVRDLGYCLSLSVARGHPDSAVALQGLEEYATRGRK